MNKTDSVSVVRELAPHGGQMAGRWSDPCSGHWPGAESRPWAGLAQQKEG